MSQYHDTVREELEEIFGVLQKLYRQEYPESVMLFTDKVFGELDPNPSKKGTQTIDDVASAIQSLAPATGTKHTYYHIYMHRFEEPDQIVGMLDADARQGLITVQFSDRQNPLRNMDFKMEVGFGGRVIGYQLKVGKDDFRTAYQKSHITTYLQELFANSNK